MIVAVLTGDLIDSTTAGAAATDLAMMVLADTAHEISLWPGAGPTRFTRFRGDGWQLLVTPQKYALRAALTLAARLRATPDAPPTRIAIGLGRAESIGGTDLSDAHGPAFAASGHALEAMPRGARLTLGGTIGRDPGRLASALIDLLDERIGRWTPEQAEAAAFALDPDDPTQAEIAGQLGISSQAVSYRLGGAGMAAIRRALQAWEAEADEQEKAG